ncbi:hypothetical protein FRC12_002304 [Ceratobasidium sp. 428]|nr:hypothetical protein FRC12_002304 [Ceratobasidium sp. 428]
MALATNGAKIYIDGQRAEKVVSASTKEYTSKVAGRTVPDKESIKNAVKTVSGDDGKLDVLFNNAADTGPVSMFFNSHPAPENKNTETLGSALFDDGSFEKWGGLYTNNVASIFLVTSDFLGLLQKASYTRGAWSASVVNISSVFPSEMTSAEGEDLDSGKPDERLQSVRTVPFRRGESEADMGGAALFLVSPASYYITGQVLNVGSAQFSFENQTDAIRIVSSYNSLKILIKIETVGRDYSTW